MDDRKYVFAEYTTQKKGLVAKIRDDINKCLDESATNIPVQEITEIVYCHTSSNLSPAADRELHELCRAKGVQLELWGIDFLAEKLRMYPSLLREHLHIAIDSEQIQTADDFVLQYDSNALAAPLNTAFLFREDELAAIDAAFQAYPVVLVTGPAGTGKTRLALEYARNHSARNNQSLVCIHDRALPLYDELVQRFEVPGDYFIFVDDANQLSRLEHIIQYANKKSQGYHVQILMTVRDYAVAKVKEGVCETVNYGEVQIKPFSSKQISDMMETHYGIKNSKYLERICSISAGNARIAMLAGKIACGKNRLDSINDVSELYENYYGRALREAEMESDTAVLTAAGIMAFLNVIHLDHIEAIQPILNECGISQKAFENALQHLHNHEIVNIYFDKGVKFSEQCLSNFVLKYVFYDKKLIKLSSMIEACFGRHRERTVYAINTLIDNFRIDGLYHYVEEEVCGLWDKLESNDSPLFGEYMKVFFRMNELRALEIMQERIEKCTPVLLTITDIDTEEGKNRQQITDDTITVLSDFAYSENLDAALDLFFQYYLKRPDLYMQFFHAATSYYSIGVHAIKNDYGPQVAFINKLYEYSDNWENAYITLLFLNIASEFLQLEFSPHVFTPNGKAVKIYHIQLTCSHGVDEYRSMIWKQLIQLAQKSEYHDQVRHILHSYGRSIQECSNEVVMMDAEYICKISQELLSPSSLADCRTAKHLKIVLDGVSYRTDVFQPLLSSSKYSLYRAITGPGYDVDISYEERQMETIGGIQEYIISAPNKPDAFEAVLNLYVEALSIKDNKHCEIGKAINIALAALVGYKEDYIACAKMILKAEYICEVDILTITNALFSFLLPDTVLELIESCVPKNRNEWVYAFFHEYPAARIDSSILSSLYCFLADDSDQFIKQGPYRDIDFLDKYAVLDSNVVVNASRIILCKREYSPLIVCRYFSLQFNEQNIKASDVIQKYCCDIHLLEEIYLYVAENGHLVDYNGVFLAALFQCDRSFIFRYAKWLIAKAQHDTLSHYEHSIELFFLGENYMDILDYMIDEGISNLSLPGITVPGIIKAIHSAAGNKSHRDEHFNQWVSHYIRTNYADKDKMSYIFEALTEISLDMSSRYVKLLLECTTDFSIFNAIPLVPRSASWSGSSVPMYSSWVKHLNSLLSMLGGAKFMMHKRKVTQNIEAYKKKIIDEQLTDILYG